MTRSTDPRESADLAHLKAMGFDPDLPDALDIGPGGIDRFPRPDEHEIVTPDAYVEYLCASHGVARRDLAVHPWLLATFQRATLETLVRETGATLAPAWESLHAPVYHGKIGTTLVSIVRLSVGAPVAITRLEELIALGAQRVVVLGTAGALQSDLPTGSLVLPKATVREEGTSFHYVPAGSEVKPDDGLVDALMASCAALGVAVRQGTVWTTDAPYREIASKVQVYRAMGLLAVEMEAAALFAVAALRGIRLALLLAISDHLGEVWRPNFLSPEMRTAATTLSRVAVAAIARSTAP